MHSYSRESCKTEHFVHRAENERVRKINEENTKKNKQFKSTIEGFSLTSSLGDLLRRKSLNEVFSLS